MKISFVEIKNFRKLKSCRVEFSDKETIFVGANNSGKTTAMDVLILFLKKSRRKDITTTDFTLSNWSGINEIASEWISNKDKGTLDLALTRWEPYLPSLDVWLDVDESNIHYVSHLIPTLDWDGGLLGVRLLLEPKNIEDLYKEFLISFNTAKESTTSAKRSKKKVASSGNPKLSLWPKSMRDFLDRKLNNCFEIKAYILDRKKCQDCVNGNAQPQALPPESHPLDREPFDGLFKIDIINAQRGFTDPSTGENTTNFENLSTQLRKYFSQHLNPSERPEAGDIEALEAIETARAIFDEKLAKSFKPAIGELEQLNYPGFSDPHITLTSNIDPIDILKHDAAVQFDVNRVKQSASGLLLPEKYNGLGYKNLISMVFSLIRFRDEWLHVGKLAKKQNDSKDFIEPLHLVLIEEPEAHLHAQVQQVFIKKAFIVLRNHKNLKKNSQFCTQMIVSTHSNHIAHEINFTCLRYFKRKPAQISGEVPYAVVVNLKKTFGAGDQTSKFATRYLKATHCDLFFADAAILVEGPAERMLVPHFIKHYHQDLDRGYISILEIGGSHAHRLRPLIETLELLTLVVTDLDSMDASNSPKKVPPKRKQQFKTNNTTLSTWIPQQSDLDKLLDLDKDKKESANKTIRVAYQYPIMIAMGKKNEEAIPYTFEDALVLGNMELFKKMKGCKGLIKKLVVALNKSSLDDICAEMFKALDNGKKAEMALELLFTTEPDQLKPPAYISEGLAWLQDKLVLKSLDFPDKR